MHLQSDQINDEFKPESVNVGSFRERQLVLVHLWAHLFHDLWSQVVDPPVRNPQHVLLPER